jgi:hypothetical protein
MRKKSKNMPLLIWNYKRIKLNRKYFFLLTKKKQQQQNNQKGSAKNQGKQ